MAALRQTVGVRYIFAFKFELLNRISLSFIRLSEFGDFAAPTSTACVKSKNSLTEIVKELDYVKKECAYFTEKLADATDVHIGLELIHLFILDLLGRTTPAAKIFLNKASSEFRHVAVMPKSLKAFAWICVFLLNAFFVYFTMLKGMQREESWQKGFLLACIVQILIEVFSYCVLLFPFVA